MLVTTAAGSSQLRRGSEVPAHVAVYRKLEHSITSGPSSLESALGVPLFREAFRCRIRPHEAGQITSRRQGRSQTSTAARGPPPASNLEV